MIEFIGYLTIFAAGAWASFMAGFLGHHFTSRGGFEGVEPDLAAGCVTLALFVAAFIWWLT